LDLWLGLASNRGFRLDAVLRNNDRAIPDLDCTVTYGAKSLVKRGLDCSPSPHPVSAEAPMDALRSAT